MSVTSTALSEKAGLPYSGSTDLISNAATSQALGGERSRVGFVSRCECKSMKS